MVEFVANAVVVLIVAIFGCGVIFSVFGRLFEQRRKKREAQRLEELLREDPPWKRPRILRNRHARPDGLWQAMVERLEPARPNDSDAVDASLCFEQNAEPRVFRDRHTGQVWVRYYVDNEKEGHAYGYWEELSPFPFDATPPVSVLRQGQ
jgi:hypothetical protein